MDVLLARPPSRTLPFIYEDLGLETVAAALRTAGFGCRIDDLVQHPVPLGGFVERLANAPEKIIGLTLHAEPLADAHLRLFSELKRASPDKLIVVGGHPVAAIAGEISVRYPQAFDVLVHGEGDQSAVELMRHWSCGSPALDEIPGISFRSNGRVQRTAIRSRAPWHLRPHPARDAWESPTSRPLTGSALVAFSQGCNHRCTFCSVAAYHGRGQDDWRARTIDSFTRELVELQDRYGVSDFTVVDPNFIGHPTDPEGMVRDFCRAVRSANLNATFEIATRIDSLTPSVISRLREAGVRRVFVGVESGVEAQLRAWRKQLAPSRSLDTVHALFEAEIYVELGMIVLQPSSTLDDIRTNLAFLRRLPYFNLYNLDQTLWPLHVGDGGFNMDERLLDPSPERIFRTYRFRDERVSRYSRFAAELCAGLGDLFYRVRKLAWDNLSAVPGMLGRFRDAQQSLLAPYLIEIENGLSLIEAEATEQRIVDAARESVARLRPELVRIADRYTADVGGTPVNGGVPVVGPPGRHGH